MDCISKGRPNMGQQTVKVTVAVAAGATSLCSACVVSFLAPPLPFREAVSGGLI